MKSGNLSDCLTQILSLGLIGFDREKILISIETWTSIDSANGSTVLWHW